MLYSHTLNIVIRTKYYLQKILIPEMKSCTSPFFLRKTNEKETLKANASSISSIQDTLNGLKTLPEKTRTPVPGFHLDREHCTSSGRIWQPNHFGTISED